MGNLIITFLIYNMTYPNCTQHYRAQRHGIWYLSLVKRFNNLLQKNEIWPPIIYIHSNLNIHRHLLDIFPWRGTVDLRRALNARPSLYGVCWYSNMIPYVNMCLSSIFEVFCQPVACLAESDLYSFLNRIDWKCVPRVYFSFINNVCAIAIVPTVNYKAYWESPVYAIHIYIMVLPGFLQTSEYWCHSYTKGSPSRRSVLFIWWMHKGYL